MRNNKIWSTLGDQRPEVNHEYTSNITPVLVTVRDGDGYYHVDLAVYCENEVWRWYDGSNDLCNMDIVEIEVLAWMDAPEPWYDDYYSNDSYFIS